MRKILIIILMCVVSVPILAQKVSVENSNYGLQISPYGFYGYNERLLASQMALRVELGMEASIGSIIGSNTTKVYLIHHLSLEPRYYYNLTKRAKAHKNTYGNSGEFLAMRMRLRPGYILSDNSRLYAVPTLSFTPTWGFRRVIKEKLVVELGAGVGYKVYLDDIKDKVGDGEISHLVFNLHCRFGIHFGRSKD